MNIQWINAQVHRIARLAGVDYRRYNSSNFVHLRRNEILHKIGVATVIDVGAHDGGYGLEIRRSGYKGSILSFEPLSTPYQRLKIIADADGSWQTRQMGIGSESGELPINISAHHSSSSFLKMIPVHMQACPGSQYCRVENVKIERLDKLLNVNELKAVPTWLKADVQGFEKHVLDGAEPLISFFAGIELELSLVPLYEGAPLLEEIVGYLRQHGFSPVSIEDAFFDPQSARLMQVNGIFLPHDL